jgi:hypothetical protein
MFGDEASFWLDGSLHRTWARVGLQPQVDTFGMRKTAHVFGVVSVEQRPRFDFLFAPVFNGDTFLLFLKHIVKRSRRKLFLIFDNAPCHNLKAEGKAWLGRNRHRIELFRLPPTRPTTTPQRAPGRRPRSATHNRFFRTTDERDAALVVTFEAFKSDPALLAGHLARFI